MTDRDFDPPLTDAELGHFVDDEEWCVKQHEQLRLLAERGTLQKMIAETPPDDVLDLASLEARLAQVNHLLANSRLEPEPAQKKKKK